ncbi:MAG: hypothetical protein CM15mP2_1490 [Methanobacteriota archaeon]|nr:MAG: hypothetical protein CM15mP2_1490 [Euryarchaeota archaeon]
MNNQNPWGPLNGEKNFFPYWLHLDVGQKEKNQGRKRLSLSLCQHGGRISRYFGVYCCFSQQTGPQRNPNVPRLVQDFLLLFDRTED